MDERVQPSVEELFRENAPELLKFLFVEDLFWKQIQSNTITETELRGHQNLLEELGRTPKDSAVLKRFTRLEDLDSLSCPRPSSFI